jgi:acetate kinase
MNKEKKKKLVFDLMVDRIVGFIGNYYVKLGGKVDALTFSGGIGEGSDILRKAVVEKVSCLGFGLDEKANASIAEEIVHDIGSSRGDKRVLVVKTDEQVHHCRFSALVLLIEAVRDGKRMCTQ